MGCCVRLRSSLLDRSLLGVNSGYQFCCSFERQRRRVEKLVKSSKCYDSRD
jgi:hypothetical protein